VEQDGGSLQRTKCPPETASGWSRTVCKVPYGKLQPLSIGSRTPLSIENTVHYFLFVHVISCLRYRFPPDLWFSPRKLQPNEKVRHSWLKTPRPQNLSKSSSSFSCDRHPPFYYLLQLPYTKNMVSLVLLLLDQAAYLSSLALPPCSLSMALSPKSIDPAVAWGEGLYRI
jgi:hypothetical protein